MLVHTLLMASPSNRFQPRVFYGGARSGSLGGPLVKVKRLQRYFPQYTYRYNLVYALSNAPYLPPAALNALSRRNVPLVLNQNGVFYPGWFSGDWIKKNKIMADAYHRADYVFWQSDFCRRSANKFLGTRQGAGEILFNAIDTNHFLPARISRKRPFTFLLTGKIGSHLNYRLQSTVNGLAMARRAGLDAVLRISGWIEDLSFLRNLVQSHKLSDYVVVTGVYSQQTAPLIYQAADAYVMMKYLDPCPNTVIEALACGLPILYSASGGVPELVNKEAGLGLPVQEDWNVINVPTPESIASGMLKIAEEHIFMSKAARQRAVDQFALEDWIERHNIIFEKLLDK